MTRRLRSIQYSFLFLLLSFMVINANAQFPQLSYSPTGFSFSEPVDVVNAGDGSNRLFVVEKPGRIRIIRNGVLLPTPFLNISSLVTNDVGGERGFLSLAFDPDYENNRCFFVYYNNTAGNVSLARYRTSTTNPDSAVFSSGLVLLTIVKPFGNHNGAKLNFGPDGNLWFGTGDGGSGGDPNNYSQNGTSLLGKMIRIFVSDTLLPSPYYTIPADNPYATHPTFRHEIFNMGLRNPWRWSFDRQTGAIWLADVGQGAWEEVNYRDSGTSSGINYGWRCYEGAHAYNTAGCGPIGNYQMPIFEYGHNGTTGGFSITGGYVYRGSEFTFLQGYYLCADYVSGNAWLVRQTSPGVFASQQVTGSPHITGYGEAEDGTLYTVSMDGPMMKINASTIPLKLISFTAKRSGNNVSLKWITENEYNCRQFDIGQSTDGTNFSNAGTVMAKNISTTNVYNYNYSGSATYFRLKMIDIDGRFTYSPVVRVNSDPKSGPYVYPNLISDGQLHVYPDGKLQAIQVFDAQGRMQANKRYNSSVIHDVVDVSSLQKGAYWVRLTYMDGVVVTERMILK